MLRFIDLFAGIGGMRLGFEQACQALGVESRCVFTSEIKPHAIKVLQDNYPGERIAGDISQIPSSNIPDFDILLGGFPCQAFSSAGKRNGFSDTRGTLFFEIERILRDKRPQGFILENVEGLVNHDRRDPNSSIGNTLSTILDSLESLGYIASWQVLNATNFNIPQERKRIYIVGNLKQACILPQPETPQGDNSISNILEQGLESPRLDFIDKLLSHFRIEELYNKSFRDKRGGDTNIHSWDINLRGEVSKEQKILLELLLRERRKKKWAEEFGIDWMDGMPLSLEQIKTFSPLNNTEECLRELVKMGYIKKEYPKRKYIEFINGRSRSYRKQDPTLPLGYNIVTGKLSFPIARVLAPNSIAPTLVAMDMDKLYVVDNNRLRPLSHREGLRLCGYPDTYKFEVQSKQGYDLIGNTVVVPVVKEVAKALIKSL